MSPNSKKIIKDLWERRCKPEIEHLLANNRVSYKQISLVKSNNNEAGNHSDASIEISTWRVPLNGDRLLKDAIGICLRLFPIYWQEVSHKPQARDKRRKLLEARFVMGPPSSVLYYADEEVPESARSSLGPLSRPQRHLQHHSAPRDHREERENRRESKIPSNPYDNTFEDIDLRSHARPASPDSSASSTGFTTQPSRQNSWQEIRDDDEDEEMPWDLHQTTFARRPPRDLTVSNIVKHPENWTGTRFAPFASAASSIVKTVSRPYSALLGSATDSTDTTDSTSNTQTIDAAAIIGTTEHFEHSEHPEHPEHSEHSEPTEHTAPTAPSSLNPTSLLSLPAKAAKALVGFGVQLMGIDEAAKEVALKQAALRRIDEAEGRRRAARGAREEGQPGEQIWFERIFEEAEGR